MKKGNFLNSLTMHQQKNIVTWHTITCIATGITFCALVMLSYYDIHSLNSLRKKIAMAEKKAAHILENERLLVQLQQQKEVAASALSEQNKNTEMSNAIVRRVEEIAQYNPMTLDITNNEAQCTLTVGSFQEAIVALDALKSIEGLETLSLTNMQRSHNGTVIAYYATKKTISL